MWLSFIAVLLLFLLTSAKLSFACFLCCLSLYTDPTWYCSLSLSSVSLPSLLLRSAAVDPNACFLIKSTPRGSKALQHLPHLFWGPYVSGSSMSSLPAQKSYHFGSGLWFKTKTEAVGTHVTLYYSYATTLCWSWDMQSHTCVPIYSSLRTCMYLWIVMLVVSRSRHSARPERTATTQLSSNSNC